ncbi:MAG: hypothetical protein NVSMB25_09350 [Thermoleophilaceae bacterium]
MGISSLARRRTLLPLTVAVLLLGVGVKGATAAPLRLTGLRCLRACAGPRTVAPGGMILLAGRALPRRAVAIFSVRRRRAFAAAAARMVGRSRLVVRVPSSAISGRVYLRGPRGQRSNALTLTVRLSTPPITPQGSGTPFDGNGMWIWYVERSSGGTPAALIDQARRYGISTLFIKSSDGTNPWTQFSPSLVAALHSAGLRACAWQYVYGSSPTVEAQLGADAVRAGADCLVIDAEQEYEGRYGQASTYIGALRQAIGFAYPVGLSGFPYVDYHGAFPYSVFLGPGGAQFNLPQVYWKAIGTSVDSALDHTLRYNRPYGRPIDPTGQAYDGTSGGDILRFRQLAAAGGAAGVSWWDWQEAQPGQWQAIGQPLGPFPGSPPSQDYVTLARGAQGDLVVWAQQHLRAAGKAIALDGAYGAGTEQAVSSFQSDAGLPATGRIDTATWVALLRIIPARARWWAGAARAAGIRGRNGPASAALRARRYEIPAQRLR